MKRERERKRNGRFFLCFYFFFFFFFWCYECEKRREIRMCFVFFITSSARGVCVCVFFARRACKFVFNGLT